MFNQDSNGYTVQWYVIGGRVQRAYGISKDFVMELMTDPQIVVLSMRLM